MRQSHPAPNQGPVDIGIVGVDCREGGIEIDSGKVIATLFTQQIAHKRRGKQQLSVVGGFGLRFGFGGRHQHRQPRQHPQLRGVTAVGLHALLNIVTVGFGFSQIAVRAKDHIGNPGRQIAPIFGLSGLHNHRVTLGRTRYVERTIDGEPCAVVIDRMHLSAINLAIYHRRWRPTIPQAFYQRHEFAGAVVARRMS